MESQEWHDSVVSSLARVETGISGVNRRLDVLNGSVAELFDAQIVIRKDLFDHVTTCPVKSDVRVILDRFNSMESKYSQDEGRIAGKKDATVLWLHWLRPFIYFVASGLALLILMHASDLLKAYLQVKVG